VHETRHQLSATVNDVVLTVVAGGLRLLLHRRGDPVEDVPLKAYVPVSVRTTGERKATGNRVSALYVSLPTHIEDPVERLRAIQAEVRRLLDSGQAELGAHLVDALAAVPPPLTRVIAPAAAHRQRTANLTVTNVPGPRSPLYCLGDRLIDWHAFVPLLRNQTVGVTALTYCDTLSFGITVDFRTFPDLPVLEEGMYTAFESLQKAAVNAPDAGA
jgi:diacylglycerol O-acyltransferase